MKNISSLIYTAIYDLYHIDFSPEISTAPKPELGEYCVNIFPIVKQVGKAPNMISEEVAKKLAENTEIFVSTSATGGYVNFFLTDTVWIELFTSITNLGPREKNNKTAIIENFSLNVGKPLHIGHLCPTSTGQSIINIHRYLGWHVIVDNHMGDWGSLFGKLIVGYERYGDHMKLERDGVDHLMDIYVAISADIETDTNIEQECRDAFRRLSSGDEILMKMWGEFTTYSLEKAYQIVNILHVYCDVAVGESYYE
jgi:arginyl-tRNA synthetase